MKLTHTLLSDKKWRPRNLGCLEDHTDHTVKSLIRSIRWTIRSGPEKNWVTPYDHPYGRRSHTVHTVDHTVTPKNV